MQGSILNLSCAIRGSLIQYPTSPLPISERTDCTTDFEIKLSWQHQPDQLVVIFEVNPADQNTDLSDISICCLSAPDFLAGRIGYYETTTLTRYVGPAGQTLWVGSVVLTQTGFYVLDAAVKERPVLDWPKQEYGDIDWSQFSQDRHKSSTSELQDATILYSQG